VEGREQEKLGFRNTYYQFFVIPKQLKMVVSVSQKQSNTVFDGVYVVSNVDNSRFEKAARITASSNSDDSNLEVDFYTEVFPVKKSDRLEFLMVKSIAPNSKDKLADAFAHDPRVLGKRGFSNSVVGAR
jgi:hypothetical protein